MSNWHIFADSFTRFVNAEYIFVVFWLFFFSCRYKFIVSLVAAIGVVLPGQHQGI